MKYQGTNLHATHNRVPRDKQVNEKNEMIFSSMYLVSLKELQQESGHCGCNANEEIDDYEKHIGCAGHLKPERSWIHDGGYRPATQRERDRERLPVDIICIKKLWSFFSFLAVPSHFMWYFHEIK